MSHCINLNAELEVSRLVLCFLYLTGRYRSLNSLFPFLHRHRKALDLLFSCVSLLKSHVSPQYHSPGFRVRLGCLLPYSSVLVDEFSSTMVPLISLSFGSFYMSFHPYCSREYGEKGDP